MLDESILYDSGSMQLTLINLKIYSKQNEAIRTFTLCTLVDWAESHCERPISDDEAFVTKYAYVTEPERELRLFISN